MLGRASSFADRLMGRVGKTKSGFPDNSQDSDYLSPMRASTVSNRKVSRETQRGASTKEKYGIPTSQTTPPPRIEIPFFMDEDAIRTPNNSGSGYLSANFGPLPPIPLTPSTGDSSSFFDSTELFDAFPKVPQSLPNGPGGSLLSGFELRTNSDIGVRRGAGKGRAEHVPSSYRSHPSGSRR